MLHSQQREPSPGVHQKLIKAPGIGQGLLVTLHLKDFDYVRVQQVPRLTEIVNLREEGVAPGLRKCPQELRELALR